MTAVEFWYSGNRIQKTEGGVTTTYTFDDENHLTQITRGGDTIIYAYDPLGRRIAKSFGDVVNWYIYDGNAIIAAYNSSGTVTARYAHGLSIDEPLAVQRGSATSYYHADGLGSIVALTNAAGSIVQTYSYDSFGNITPSGGINQPFTYTAREYDYETGLYYYRARYYDPKAGRFVTKDPISFAGGDVNLYGYVKNNPMNWTDPTGLVVNAGFIAQLAKMANRSLQRTIKSLIKQIEKHEKALADECQKQAKQHHEHELRLFREQLRLAEQEAARRGLMGAGFAEGISQEEADKRTDSWFDWIDPFLSPGTAY